MPTHVTIDENRITHVDGKPFFLIGARHMPVGGTPELLRDAGFNAYRTLAFGHENSEPEDVPSDLEGIRFWSYIYNRADLTKSPHHEKALRERVGQLKDHPALLCYENLNEPTLLYKSDRFKAEPKNLAAGTALLRELDPHHPIWLAHCCLNTVETLQRFRACHDIVGANPYPLYVPGMRQHIGVRPDGKMLDCPDQSVHAVGKYTEKMMKIAGGKLPVWMLIQALANENWYSPVHIPEMAGQGIDESKFLYPSFAQMRFMAYDAIIAGATGLALAMCKTPIEGQPWQDIKRLVAELGALQDALTALPIDKPIEMTYQDLGFTIWDGVRTMARRKDNEVYLFAANTAFDPAQVRMALPVGIGHVAHVEQEDRTIDVEGNAICDHFKPYEIHVYRIEV